MVAIFCPECGSDNVIVSGNSKHHNDINIYVRRRKCLNCNYIFKTVEMLSEDYNDSMAITNAITKAVTNYLDGRNIK